LLAVGQPPFAGMDKNLRFTAGFGLVLAANPTLCKLASVVSTSAVVTFPLPSTASVGGVTYRCAPETSGITREAEPQGRCNAMWLKLGQDSLEAVFTNSEGCVGPGHERPAMAGP
jgi:hypothetical protein